MVSVPRLNGLEGGMAEGRKEGSVYAVQRRGASGFTATLRGGGEGEAAQPSRAEPTREAASEPARPAGAMPPSRDGRASFSPASHSLRRAVRLNAIGRCVATGARYAK